jgi:hypothetical protein
LDFHLNYALSRLSGGLAADALDLPSTQGSPVILPTFFSCSKKVGWTMAAAALDSFEKWHGCQYAKHMLLAQYEETDPACCKHLKLVNHTSVMTGTQARLPCRAVQLGEAVPLKNPAEPC